MTRMLYLLFGILAYIIFFGTFLYLIAFLGNLPWAPRTIDDGPQASLAAALVIDSALIALFGLQHSVMARHGFKRAWTRLVPEPVERSAYVLIASLVLILLFAFWRPIPAAVWRVEHAFGEAVFWAIFALGWLTVLVTTFLLSHFELFGLKQVWLNLKSAAAAPPQFRQPFLYRIVRHPLYSGFFLAFWATPAMSQGHLLFAAGMSIYMLIAIRYEERDLVDLFGDEYEGYRRQVGMLAPGVGKRR